MDQFISVFSRHANTCSDIILTSCTQKVPGLPNVSRSLSSRFLAYNHSVVIGKNSLHCDQRVYMTENNQILIMTKQKKTHAHSPRN